MNSTASSARRTRNWTLRYKLNVVRAVAGSEFRLKYADSALGYVWSLIKPLGVFAVLYFVFGRIFRLGDVFPLYPVYLLLGIVVWIFVADAVSLTFPSLVARGGLIRKLAFPRILIPISATLTSTLTFAVNLIAIAIFIAWAQIMPRPDWLLWVPLLLAELYLFVLGVGLILATLFVRFRDIGQIWELASQVLFYLHPIVYPAGYLPSWAQPVAFLSPVTQIMQDLRRVVLYDEPSERVMVAGQVLAGGRLLPVGIALVTFALGLVLFKREEGRLAERV